MDTTKILIEQLRALEPPERFKEIVRIIHHEPEDNVLRAKLTAIFDAFEFAITRELLKRCHGDKGRCIELIIENRKRPTALQDLKDFRNRVVFGIENLEGYGRELSKFTFNDN